MALVINIALPPKSPEWRRRSWWRRRRRRASPQDTARASVVKSASVVAAVAAAVLSWPSSRQGVAAGRARGLYYVREYQARLRRCPHSLVLWQLAGGPGTSCFPLPPSPVCLADGT